MAADPSNAEALFHVGIAAEIEGNHDVATASYEKALQASPGYVAAAVRLGKLTELALPQDTPIPAGGVLP